MNFMDIDENFKNLEKWLQRLPPKKIIRIQRGVAAALGLYLYGATIYNVKPGHRAQVFDRRSGLQDRVAINVRVLSCPVADELPTIYRSLGENYKDIILPSIVDETVKAVVAQYNASQLLSQREKVSSEIREILKERAAKFYIVLDDVSITSLTFGKEFAAAIEAKQVATQEAERAKYIVELAEQEKQSTVLQAQGEAKSAELIGKAIAKNPAFIALRRIEASKEISKTIATSCNKVYLDSNKLLLNL